MKCTICKKPIKKGEKYNHFFGKYSHEKCDINELDKIDKKITYR